ncbi:unnamed protein product [Pylaiella littoralis]
MLARKFTKGFLLSNPLRSVFVASFRTADGELPSGQQETDAWENLQDGLYYTWKKENEKVKMRNKRNKVAKNNPVVLTGGEGDQTLSGESTAAREKAQQQSIAEVAAARQGATADSQSAPISTVSGKRLPSRRKGRGGETQEDEEDEDQDGAGGDAQRARDVAKFGDRPDDWINPFSLAFVLFGRPAGEQEDVDLKCKVSGGGKTGAAATAAVEPGVRALVLRRKPMGWAGTTWPTWMGPGAGPAVSKVARQLRRRGM